MNCHCEERVGASTLNRDFPPIVMVGEGRPSVLDARAKEDVDGGAKPRHDDGGKAAV